MYLSKMAAVLNFTSGSFHSPAIARAHMLLPMVLRAINEGVPFVQSAPSSALAQEVSKLASWLTKQDSADESEDVTAAPAANNKMSRWMRPLPRRKTG